MIAYIASPYAVPSVVQAALLDNGFHDYDLDDLMRWRARAALRAAALLQYLAATRKMPVFFYTPIGYETVLLSDLEQTRSTKVDAVRHDGAYWMTIDHQILTITDSIVVLALPGWTASKGVAEEIDTFASLIGHDLCLLQFTDETLHTSVSVRKLNAALSNMDKLAPIDERLYPCDKPSDVIIHYRRKFQ